MTDAEQAILADMLASIEQVLIGRVPDRILKTLRRFALLMNLPAPRQYGRETPRTSERMSEAEINIVLEWLHAILPIYNGRVSAPAIDASLKLDRELWDLVHMPVLAAGWWRSLNKEQQ